MITHLHDVHLGNDEYVGCEDCLALLNDEVERYYWWERLRSS